MAATVAKDSGVLIGIKSGKAQVDEQAKTTFDGNCHGWENKRAAKYSGGQKPMVTYGKKAEW